MKLKLELHCLYSFSFSILTSPYVLGYDLVLTTDPPCDNVTAPDVSPAELKRIEQAEAAEEKADDADSEGEDDTLMMKEVLILSLNESKSSLSPDIRVFQDGNLKTTECHS